MGSRGYPDKRLFTQSHKRLYDAAMNLSETQSAGANREGLILRQMYQVELIAKSLVRSGESLDDLVAAGVVGLIAAVDGFDARKNVKLQTFAEYKIRGAMLDYLRGLDWSPRERRRRARQVEHIVARLEQRLLRPALQEEVAEELGLPLPDYHQLLIDTEWVSAESVDWRLAEVSSRSVEDELETEELWRIIREAMSKLGMAEQSVLGMYYEGGMKLREIAAELGMSLPNVAKVKARATERLRQAIRSRWPNRGVAERPVTHRRKSGCAVVRKAA
jgi:RNA polymerase sigma factor for flagellar operon FliA